MLQENILKGQRIEKFRLDYWDGQLWRTFAKATTVGYKRLLRFPEVYSDRIKIVIEQCRTNPTISSFGVYKVPPEVSFTPGDTSFYDSVQVRITSDSKGSKIYFTLDGSTPSEKSYLYKNIITLTSSTTLTTIVISSYGKRSLPVSSIYNKANYKIQYNTYYDEKYSGTGKLTLIDGFTSVPNFNTGKWQGFNGNDMDVVVDLLEQKNISLVDVGFLNNIKSYIFLPTSVEVSLSQDGNIFSDPILINNDLPLDSPEKLRKSFSKKFDNTTTRFIRIIARNIGICPDWHKGAGDKAWIFCDEIEIK